MNKQGKEMEKRGRKLDKWGKRMAPGRRKMKKLLSWNIDLAPNYNCECSK